MCYLINKVTSGHNLTSIITYYILVHVGTQVVTESLKRKMTLGHG
jgi:hypothetical protein